MPLVRARRQTAPSNTDYAISVSGTYACGNVVQPFVLDSSLTGLTSGRYALVKANSITGYVGATVTCNVPGRMVVGVSRENVNFSGTTKDCIVVTLA